MKSVVTWRISACFLAFVSLIHGDNDLAMNIGVMPTWHSVVAKALMTVTQVKKIRLHVVDVGDRDDNSYMQIENVHKKLKPLQLHGIIGPYDNAVGLAVEDLHIPYLCTSPVPNSDLLFTVQMIPRVDDICEAILEFAQVNNWKKISVFYDDDMGVNLLEKLMQNHTMSVRAWRLPATARQREVRESLVQMRKVLVEHTIVFCTRYNTQLILEEARSLAMLSTPPYQWVLKDLADSMYDLFLSYNDIALDFTVFSMFHLNSTIIGINNSTVSVNKLEYALAADALRLLTSAANNVYSNNKTESSDLLITTEGKNELMTEIRKNQETGLLGNLSMDDEGKRHNFSLYLTAVTGTYGSYLRGEWFFNTEIFNPRLKLYPRGYTPNFTTPFPLRGRTAQAVMILEKPFTMLKRDAHLRRGNDRFEGFAVDLLQHVADMLDFKFEIYLVHDGKFGSRLDNGEWNGLIGELLAGNATMSVAPLSINSQREEAVDFTKPFMTRYISVLLRVPKRNVSYFEFLNPLSPVVWICTMCAFVVVSIILYILERVGASKTRKTPKISVRESFWFIFGSLLQGNTDSSPCTIPGRILTSSWWFFALILISSYTANLAAFLTVKKINTPIKTVSDLAQQTKIKYGTVKDSGVMSFFKNTNVEHFAKMWAQMSEIEPDSVVKSTDEGYRKVKEEDYAFFWDTTVNKYKTIVDCDVMEIDPPFDPKGFGIGVPPGATYREEVSMAILKLSDQGILHMLENKWWGSRNCPDLGKPSTDETSELQIENVAGVFFILVGGIVIAAVVCVGEFFGKVLIKPKDFKKPEKNDVNNAVVHDRPVVRVEKESFL